MVSQPIPHDYDEGIDLIAVWRVLWRHKWLIIGLSFVFAVATAFVALRATEIYRAEVVVARVDEQGVSGAASLVSQLGGLASLAGVNLSGNSAGQQSKAILTSRSLAEEFIERKDLLGDLYPDNEAKRTPWFGVERFRKNVLTIREDSLNGITTVVVDWTDPATAACWANEYVKLANEVIRARALADATRNIDYLNGQIERTNVAEVQRVMYNLIESETKTVMLANARQEYAFTVVDPAVAPEVRISPRRTLMVLLGGILGGVVGVLLAFVLHLTHQYRTGSP